jgi:hypothetical protein
VIWNRVRSVAELVLEVTAGFMLGAKAPASQIEDIYQAFIMLVFLLALALPVSLPKRRFNTVRWALAVQIVAFAFIFARRAVKNGWIY